MSSESKQVNTMKCPFDPAHVMPRDRFLNHLVKCQFPDKQSYRKCKFNPYHVVHMTQLQTHENKCPDSKKFEQEDDDWGVEEVVQDKSSKKGKSQVSYSTQNSYCSSNSVFKVENLDDFNPTK